MRQIIFAVLLGVATLYSSAGFAQQKEVITYSEDKLAVSVLPEQPQFIVRLKSNPTTGFSWFLSGYNAQLLKPVKQSYLAATDKKLIGAAGYETWVFEVKPDAFIVPQQTEIHFVYARPWSVTEQANQLVFKVSTLPGAK